MVSDYTNLVNTSWTYSNVYLLIGMCGINLDISVQGVLQLQDPVHEGGRLQQDDLSQVPGAYVLPLQTAGQGNLIQPPLKLYLCEIALRGCVIRCFSWKLPETQEVVTHFQSYISVCCFISLKCAAVSKSHHVSPSVRSHYNNITTQK